MGRAREVALKLQEPFKRVINEALRAGHETAEALAKSRPFRARPHKMGLKPVK